MAALMQKGQVIKALQLRDLLDAPTPVPIPAAWMRFDQDQKAVFTRGKRTNDSEPLYPHPTAYRMPAAQPQGEVEPVEKFAETVPKFKFETLVEHCKRLEADLAQSRAHVNELTLYQQNAVWFWQHDGEDYLQSLSCPIIIQPHHLRELLEGVARHNPIAENPEPSHSGDANEMAAKVVLPERDNMRDLIAEVIGGDAYDCVRVWSAWGVGTMSEDDFVPITDQDERLYEIADSVIAEVAKLNGIKP